MGVQGAEPPARWKNNSMLYNIYIRIYFLPIYLHISEKSRTFAVENKEINNSITNPNKTKL